MVRLVIGFILGVRVVWEIRVNKFNNSFFLLVNYLSFLCLFRVFNMEDVVILYFLFIYILFRFLGIIELSFFIIYIICIFDVLNNYYGIDKDKWVLFYSEFLVGVCGVILFIVYFINDFRE